MLFRSSRSFKFWDCNVPVSGTVYDGSGISPPEAIECSIPTGFSKLVGDINFTGLTFKNITGDKSMTINSPNYSSGVNYLTWGKIYTFAFNPDIGLNTAGVKMKLSNNSICQSTIDLTNNTTVNPYESLPSLRADFSGVVDQDPWWQAIDSELLTIMKLEVEFPERVLLVIVKLVVMVLVLLQSFIIQGKQRTMFILNLN